MRRRLAWTPPAKSARAASVAEPGKTAGHVSPGTSEIQVSGQASRPSATVARAPRRFDSPEALGAALRGAAYVAGEGLSTAAFLAISLGKPLLLEGAPGVGKTEAGKALAEVLGRDLIRLQCYEGMDSSAALYEWNYPAQMLALRRAGRARRRPVRRGVPDRTPASRRVARTRANPAPHRRDRSLGPRV